MVLCWVLLWTVATRLDSAATQNPDCAEYVYSHGRAWCKDGAPTPGTAAAVSLNPIARVPSVARPSAAVITALTDVKGALRRAYDLKDSTANQMASLHLLDTPPGETGYSAVYMSMQHGKTWEVRSATSTDLMTWSYANTLLPNADMPYAYRLAPNGWILLVHEQWMRTGPGGSAGPSRLGFKLYYNHSDLMEGRHFNSFVAPLSVGQHTGLEGTPNVYSAKQVYRDGYYMVDATIGFHFNDATGVDQVAHGTLTSFGPTVVSPTWAAAQSTAYDDAFKQAGAIGNIGQRDSGVLGGELLLLQEGNTGHMPPTIWAAWKLWLYTPAQDESFPPAGNGTITELLPVTDGGSTAFGNPSFKVVPCPSSGTDGDWLVGDCVFVSFFAFGEGAAPGEAGVVAFYNRAPNTTAV